MARALVDQALALRERFGDFRVGLCGGVFQNRRLSELCLQLLRDHGFAVHLAERLPVNDAALSFGQLVEYGCGGGRAADRDLNGQSTTR
jgi:hydrogenase maturation protein HypF